MNKVVLILVAVTLQACSSRAVVEYQIPRARLQPPEAQGELAKFNIILGAEPQTKHTVSTLEVSESFFSGNVDTEYGHQNSLSDHDSPGSLFTGNLGITPRLDLFVRSSSDSAQMYGLKYQFLGGDRKAIGTKASLSLAYGIQEESDTASIENRDGDSFSGEVNMDVDVFDSLFSIGNRLNEKSIIYASYYLSEYRNSSNITVSDNTLKFNETLTSRGLILGTEYRRKQLSIIAETGFGSDSTSEESLNYTILSLSAGFNM